MVGYSTWASYHCAVSYENIEPIVAYLKPPYAESTISVNEFDAQEFISCVESETRQMYEYCSDIDRNIPKPKALFVQTERSIVCKYCNYRELCGR
jgi:hypothetical protein